MMQKSRSREALGVLPSRRPRPDIAEQVLSGSGRDRPGIYEQWLNFIARHVFSWKLESRAPEASAFQVQSRSRAIDGFSVVRDALTADRCLLRRAAADIASDDRDVYALHVSVRGDMDVAQFRRGQWVCPGSYALVSSAEPATIGNGQGGQSDIISFMFPREFVDQRSIHPESLCVRPFSKDNGMHSLTFDTVCTFEKNAWNMTDDEFKQSSRIVADLVLLSLSGSIDLACGERSVRAANLARVKRIMQRRFAEPDLTLSDLARESGFSLRYLHRLFRDEGQTMWEYLKGQRLKRARQMLERPTSSGTTVTDVSQQCGFANMSHFSTLFKQAFGVSPRDVLRRH